MPRTVPPTFPGNRRQLTALGERLRLARKRRGFSAVLMAERVGISRDTFNRVEKGDPAVSLGTYLKVLRVLGLDADLDAVAKDDVLGRKLQDLSLDAGSNVSTRRKSLSSD
jgi:transcriptional regulator with XRE-family HTH domain